VANINDNAPTTGNPYLDSLIWGGSWVPDGDDPPGGVHISYYYASGLDPFNSFTFAWSQREIDAFDLSFQLYENVANINFVQVFNESDADILERLTTGNHLYLDGALGAHEVPDPTFWSEALFGYYNVEHDSWNNLAQGGYGFITVIHELGHALGLAHPHDGGDEDFQAFPGVTPNNTADTGDFGLNQGIWTTMTYNDGWNVLPGVYPSYGYQGTPMAFDIAALQALYGANTTYNTGDDVYALPGMNASGTFWSCIWDAGGIDEISADGLSGACKINLNDATLQVGDPNAGGFVSSMVGIRGGFTIANTAEIENATGGKGNDTLTGNELDNLLTGNAGNDSLIGWLGADTLDGGLGTDRMSGGDGDDLYWATVAGDVAVELAAGGNDTVKSFATYTLGAEVEILELQGALMVNGTGNTLDNLLIGNSAANILDGKTGADTMQGGEGGDTYIVDQEADEADEGGGDGTDTVKSSAASYKLGSDIENLLLTGKAIAGDGNLLANIIIGTAVGNELSGNAGNDSLSGGSGNDTLDGGDDADTLDGGLGSDEYSGGAGDDLYKVDTGDVIAAGADDGVDTVESLITFTLGGDQENLTLAGTGALKATGNAGKNVLTGNAGANILEGLADADTLIGGGGNDTYVIDSSSDEVTEADKGGTDTVKSSQSFLLSDFVEKLELTGSGDIDGSGNGLGNVIVGNLGDNGLFGLAGNDTLTGGDGDDLLDGGDANDAMTGGNGNDVYVVGSTSDKVTESSAAGGNDTVESGVTYTLGMHLESLVLTAGDTKGTGNTLANLIIGSAGKNILCGKSSADTMRGGDGDDTYIVDLFDEIDETGADGEDTIQIAASFDLLAPIISVLGTIENLTLTGTGAFAGAGSGLDNAITGNSGANTLSGFAGNDTIDGGGGNDTMIGGDGDDTYGISSAKDVVQEDPGKGTDAIRATIAIDLNLGIYDGIENVVLTGAGALKAIGDDADNELAGNDGGNLLIGGIGLDTLTGGKGNDTLDGDVVGDDTDSLAGGLGNDTYLVDKLGDIVTEGAGEGTDTVRSAVSGYALTANVENLVLLAGVASGAGNDLKNVLTGNDLANTLDGGLLVDTLSGGKGDDTYHVDELEDVVKEAAGGGVDTVHSTAAAYTLGVNVENLTLDAGGISGTGNTLNNILRGNSGDNTLSGGAGKDRMIGRSGDDTYVVDNAGDVVDEDSGGGGSDRVLSSIAFSLESLAVEGNVEHLTLAGAAAISGTGNQLANVITGNAGANTLSGQVGNDTLDGGGGNDNLIGGAGDDQIDVATGNDTVRYTTALDGHDLITNFDGNASGGQDVLNLDALFDSLGVVAADRAGRVNIGPLVGSSVDIQADVSVAGDPANVVTVATLNLANPADLITVGPDVVLGT
jgi:Ca2+-binding RTX toxin-like protein